MKPILSLFFLLLLFASFSGDLNNLHWKCCNCPNLNDTTYKILVAVNTHTRFDQRPIENCIDGLKITLDLQSHSKITTKITLEKKLDTKVLKELQKNYSVNGLLFLAKLKIKKKAYDIPRNEIEYFDNGKPESFFEIIGQRNKPWTNLFVEITSKWNYYDFNSGKQYDFEIKNNHFFEFKKYVSNVDTLVDANQTLFDPMFYQNGKLIAEKFLKRND